MINCQSNSSPCVLPGLPDVDDHCVDGPSVFRQLEQFFCTSYACLKSYVPLPRELLSSDASLTLNPSL